MRDEGGETIGLHDSAEKGRTAIFDPCRLILDRRKKRTSFLSRFLPALCVSSVKHGFRYVRMMERSTECDTRV